MQRTGQRHGPDGQGWLGNVQDILQQRAASPASAPVLRGADRAADEPSGPPGEPDSIALKGSWSRRAFSRPEHVMGIDAGIGQQSAAAASGNLARQCVPGLFLIILESNYASMLLTTEHRQTQACKPAAPKARVHISLL